LKKCREIRAYPARLGSCIHPRMPRRHPTESRDTRSQPEPPRPPMQSYARFRPPVARAPRSTIPPPPLRRDAELAAVEWWLDAHMNVASNLLCLEQAADSIKSKPSAARRIVEKSLAPLGEVRDALYELYCDATDARMQPLLDAMGPLPVYVRALYLWYNSVLEALVALATDLQRGQPDCAYLQAAIDRSTTSFKASSQGMPERVAEALDALPIEPTSPVEPLRGLRRHFAQLVFAVRSLADSIAPSAE
jgi:hypothetical protein